MAEEDLTIELPSEPEDEFSGHHHTGSDTPKVLFKDLKGLIEVVSALPTSKPRNIYEQVKLYVTGTDGTFCIYDYENNEWKAFGTGGVGVAIHASAHQDGGADEIDATNLDGTASKTLTTSGDILYEGASGLTRLAGGDGSYVLTMDRKTSLPIWRKSPFQQVLWSNTGNVSDGATVYSSPGHNTLGADGTKNYITVPFDCVIASLMVKVYTNEATSTSSVLLDKDGEDTTLTVSIPAGAVGAFKRDDVTVAFSAGDSLNFKCVNGGGGDYSIGGISIKLSRNI